MLNSDEVKVPEILFGTDECSARWGGGLLSLKSDLESDLGFSLVNNAFIFRRTYV
jgi:hypothetical protein